MVSHDVNLVREFNFREIKVNLESEGGMVASILDDGLII